MKTIYIADDGTQFDDYEDCAHYETVVRFSQMNLKSKFFDQGGNPFDITDENNSDGPWFADIVAGEEDFVSEIFDEFGWCYPSDNHNNIVAGTFYYDETYQGWLNVDDLWHKYKTVMDVFNGKGL